MNNGFIRQLAFSFYGNPIKTDRFDTILDICLGKTWCIFQFKYLLTLLYFISRNTSWYFVYIFYSYNFKVQRSFYHVYRDKIRAIILSSHHFMICINHSLSFTLSIPWHVNDILVLQNHCNSRIISVIKEFNFIFITDILKNRWTLQKLQNFHYFSTVEIAMQTLLTS